MTEAVTVALQSAGDFTAFYESQYRRTLLVVYAFCGSWAVAEELAQDAFIKAMREWRVVGAMDRPDAWVRRVAVNLATSTFRRRAAEARALVRLRARPGAPGEDTPDELLTFLAAVRQLPRRQAQAVVLHYVDDLAVAQVAEVMGCAVGTVKSHLAAARPSLLSALGEQDA